MFGRILEEKKTVGQFLVDSFIVIAKKPIEY